MAGIYIHIPFCRKACTYCNFHFSTTLSQKHEVLNAIEQEIKQEAEHSYNTHLIETIYFGGGTPSLLTADELLRLMNAAGHFNISDDAEITLEANPDDIDPETLANWKRAGVNRLSVGIQSFEQEELKWMNRAHNSAQALQCIVDIKKSEISNFSADLIYGSPLLSDEQLLNNLEILCSHRVPHISCYALTVEPRTALDAKIKQQLSPDVSSDTQSRHFLMVMNYLRSFGYEHYEISNFALPGFRSRHNSSYWKGLPYFGFGPSAHGFDGENIRKWNVSNNSRYVSDMRANVKGQTMEVLTVDEKWNEFVMISLRTAEGLSLETSERKFGSGRTKKLIDESNTWIDSGKIVLKNQILVLTDEGKLFADGIAASLFA